MWLERVAEAKARAVLAMAAAAEAVTVLEMVLVAENMVEMAEEVMEGVVAGWVRLRALGSGRQ